MKKIISMLLAVVMAIGVLPITSFATSADLNVIEQNSSYSILLPENASDELQNAAEELNLFLDEITGVTLPVVTDDGSATSDGYYISIGNTGLFQNSGVSANALETEASAIKTVGNSILLYGGSDVGATYAVYELLEHWFDLKFYTPDCYTYTAKETVAFEELDLTSTPAVDHRTAALYLTWFSGWTNLRRMRVSNTGEYMNGLGHSLADLLPPATYYAEHPEWYSNYADGQVDNWQVCLSNADMRAQLIANVKAELAADSDCKYFAIGQNDGDGFCTCDDCLALNLQYSSSNTSYSGAWLAMVNEVANACAAEYPDVVFYMLAYTNRTDLAPTKNITAASNVGVMIAPISSQRTDSYFGNSGDSELTNGRVTTVINGWDGICDHLMMWGYISQFGDAMVPLNIYDSLAANAQGYAEYDFEVVFEQGQSSVLPFFDTMRTYLITKALYDGDIDTFGEAESFINAYYGAAAPAMNSYFDSFLANLRSFEAKGDRYKSFVASQYLNGDWAYSPAIIADNYSKSYVDSCKAYFDTAYAALANAYSADSSAYKTYKKRLDLEYLGVLYLYLELYADQLTQEQGAQMAQDVFRIVDEQSVVAIKNEQINGWRTQFGVVPDGVDYTFFETTNQSNDCAFHSYSGTVGGETIDGIRVTSYAYQPHFNFTEEGVALIKSIAEANGYDSLIIHHYAIINSGNSAERFALNGVNKKLNEWVTTNVDIDEITTSYDFWSQSSGQTEVYMWFEFGTMPIINAGSFESTDAAKPVNFANYTGLLNNSGFTATNEEFTGVYVTSSATTPSFKFTAEAVEEIKAYAAENGYSHLKIYANAVLTASSPRFVIDNGGTYQTYVAAAKWYSHADAMPIDYISENIKFYSQFSNTQVYLKFEFIQGEVENPYDQAIHAGSFESTDAANKPVTFEDYKGLLNNSGFTATNEEFVGVYVTSSAAAPSFKFTAEAVEEIKAYAAENGYSHLKIYANAVLTESSPRFIIDNGGTYQTYVAAAKWYSNAEAMPIDYISENIIFYSQFSNTQVYLKFEFIQGEVENPYDQAIHAGSFESTDATNKPVTFEDYKGLLNNSGFTGTNEEFTGVYVTSSAATPSFKFTAEAVEEIKAYAAENGYTHLKIYANAVLTESSPRFIIDNGGTYQTYVAAAKWYSNAEAMPIDYISENIKFYSQFSNTQVYLKFEFIQGEVENPYDQAIHAGSFESTDATNKPVTFEDYKGLLNNSGFTATNEEFVGVYVTSSAATPSFKFTAEAVEEIKAYAAENGYTHLKIYANAVLTESSPRFIIDQNGTYQTYVAAAKWYSNAEAMPIDYISENIKFYSQFSNTQVYLKFEFSHVCEYGEWVVTTPATLQTAGEKQKTCSCGNVITEEIPCLAGDVEAWNLTLGGDLSVNFVINVHEDIRETAQIVITVAGNAQSHNVVDLTPNANDGFYYVSVNVAAAQMNDTITVQIVNGEDASVTKEYTVLQYATAVLANDSYSTYHSLVKEMLNYGAAAQTYFGYNDAAENLVNAGITGAGALDVPANAAADMAVSGSVDGISFYGASLMFRNKIAVRYYFTVTGDINDYTFKVNGAEVGYDEKDGLYYIEVADINPQDLDDAITVTVNDTLSVSYSPMNYIVRMSTKGSENLQALMKALYNYHVAAEGICPDAE